MRARIVIAVAAVGWLTASIVQGQAAPPWAGTWKLNPAKSKYSPGPAPKSSTIKVEATKDGIRQSQDQVTAAGETRHIEVSAMFDGKDAAVKGNPEVDTQSFKKLDDRSYEVTAKKNGKVTTVSKVAISADGKTRTTTQTGTNTQGQKVNNTIVYEKQ